MQTYFPVRKDSRYTITQEHCGYPEARYVLRFCGDFIAQSSSKGAVTVRAVGHNNARTGGFIIEGQE